MKLHRIAICLLAAAALAVPGGADTHPNLQTGFAAEKSFQMGDVDSVNGFNGNLVVTIPIGPTYPVGGELSYGLTLVFNSNPWLYQESCGPTGCRMQAIANPRTDAGFGWTLSLGHLFDGGQNQNGSGNWLYVGPDGGEHSFEYQTLHDGETGGTSTVRYTRDGSYLRMKTGTREVELPNGVVHQFRNDGDLHQMRDRFGNTVTLAKPTNLAWTLTDTHNRVQYINYVPDPVLGKRINNIVLTGFNGSTTTYTFVYTQMSVARPCDSDQSLGNLVVSMLTSVTATDSTGTLAAWSMPSYALNQSAGCKAPGSILKLVLPTQGSVAWTYQAYVFPNDGGKAHRQRSNGVATRTLYDAAGVALGPAWQYTTAMQQYVGTPSTPMELVNTVTDPLGNKTETFFSVAFNDFNPPWKLVEYGLPLARSVPDATGNRFLSTKTYAAGGALLRSSFVRYEVDAGTGFGGTIDQASRRDQRLASTRTVFHDDLDQGVPRYADVDLSSFDGLGHYRTTQSGVDFDTTAVRTETTDFNSGRGTYPGSFTMLGSSEKWILDTYALQQATEAGKTAKRTFYFDANGWLERTRVHSLDTGSESGNDVVVETLQTAGNLSSERYYGGDVPGTLGTGPLAALTLPATQYRIDYTTQFGSRATATYVDAGGSPLSFKTLDQTIDSSSGLVASSRDTSAIATTYEYDGLGRLRFAKPQANHDGWTEYVYTLATGPNALARVDIKQLPNGGGTALAQSAVKFDALGRVWQEQQLMPDNNTWATRQTLYYANGWKESVSELGNVAKKTTYSEYDPFGRPGLVTPPDGFDHKVNFAYAGVRTVGRSVKVADVLNDDEHAAWTTEIYDRQGRLSQVKEEAQGSYPTFTNTTTSYTYDVGNRIFRVQQQTSAGTQNRWFTYDQRGFLLSEVHPEKGASGNGFVFHSNYDSRGHAGRRHECSNQACNVPGEPKADLTFGYDRAERVTTVSQAGVGTLKSFTYGTSNAANVRTNGRLHVATRYNYLSTPYNPAVPLQIDETYTYGGRQGRPSHRLTQFRIFGQSPNRIFEQTWTYDPLGNVTSLGYPNCTFTPCPSVPRTVSQVYTQGRLTAVTGFADAITYHPNGMVNQVTHTNGVVDTQANDPDGMARPASLAARRAGASSDLWSTGTYLYDGAGNVKKMGNAYFLYDHVSRVIDGHVYDGPTGGGQLRYQTYTYDPFGNLTNIGGDPVASGRSTPTNALTNRHNGASYDVAGNMVGFNGATYEVDGFGMMTKMLNGAEDWRYVYTAGDERLFEFRQGGGAANWSLRDLDGKVLREFREQTGWSPREYFYRGGQLLASEGTQAQMSFTDVPPTHPYAAEIEAMKASGVTTGCGADQYCPVNNATRAATIVFVYRARGIVYNPAQCSLNGFAVPYTDVPDTHPFCAYIARAKAEGLTGGCGPDIFCPENPVGRGAVAVYTSRANAWNPPACIAGQPRTFSDVPATHPFCSHIEETDRRGIDHGCGGGAFCPDSQVSRGAISPLIVRGFSLPYPDKGYTRHYHLDHLGTPRLITSTAMSKLAYHAYLPFGEELTSTTQDGEQMKFTGHERDLGNPASVADDLDYMHARFYSPLTARFLSVDPAGGDPVRPQSWNRYAYALGNPVQYVDPDGQTALVFTVASGEGLYEAFGHSAVFVQAADGDSAGVSYGGDFDFSDGVGAFIEGYNSEGRTVIMSVLETTSEQDRAMIDFIRRDPFAGTDIDAAGAGIMVRENCAKAVSNVLRAGGLVGPGGNLSKAGPLDLPTALMGRVMN